MPFLLNSPVSEDDSLLIPWLEVKQAIDNEKQRNYLYGLFALRDFKCGSIIGVYLGIFLDHQCVESPFLMKFTEDIVIDIPDKGEERLSYAMGAHMMNDQDYPFGVSENEDSLNNVQIESDYSCVASRDITRGDELTVSYNFAKQD